MFEAQKNTYYKMHQDRPLYNKSTNLQPQSVYADPGVSGASPTLSSPDCPREAQTRSLPHYPKRKHQILFASGRPFSPSLTESTHPQVPRC